jgi:hypothetical protein
MRRCADTRAQAAIKTVAARSPPQALASIVPEAAAGQLGHGTPAQPHILDILQDAFNFHNSAFTTPSFTISARPSGAMLYACVHHSFTDRYDVECVAFSVGL